MKIQSVAHSYWRRIKAGARTFESLSDEVTDFQKKNGYSSMRDQVLYLAISDVKNDVITEGQFEDYTGLVYAEVKDTFANVTIE